MKKNFSFLAILLLVAFTPAFHGLYAQKAFEGTITWSMSIAAMGDDEKIPWIINIKGQKLEMEMDMGAMGEIQTYTDMEKKKGYFVMAMGGKKTGYLIDATDSDVMNSYKTTMDDIDPVPTGKTETIAGHAAAEYLLKGVKAKGVTMDMSMWLASDFPKDVQKALSDGLTHGSGGQDPKENRALKKLYSHGLVPVRIVASAGDEVAMTMEFVKYQQKSLDDALFIPPADVKFSPMPKTLGGTN
jgi:hypothetical protein